ncbi:MAG TPA: phosphoribosylamine--glycine ligase [Acidimicrobiales bacterium]|nr:phosphoribosylamine--glycine ligase [Acidimicrobiales bacterium]
MKVCVVGSGGREHALAHVLSRTTEVVVTPGNAGIPGSVSTPPEELDAELFVIGPEVPLVDGLADRLRAAGKAVFGPGADGARLEGSKRWMKEVLADAGVPTARWGAFDDAEAASAFLASLPGPFVVKTDGLAAGKGVLVTDSRAEAEADVREKLAGDAFGDAGRRVVIEEGLAGPELSVLAVCDGSRVVPLPAARDHKRVGDGDTGPNTGGMGAYCPVPEAGPALLDAVMERAIEPTLAELRRRGVDYRGVLYAGLMLTAEGPKVLEYNARFGDPEAQVVLPLLEGDVAGLLASAAAGRLEGEPKLAPGACVTVVLCSEGYPGSPRVGDNIEGLEEVAGLVGVTVFHAGTRAGPGGRLVTGGGRVLNVTAMGADLAQARSRAYAAAAKISWPGLHYRTDIAANAADTKAADTKAADTNGGNNK